jgi:hypothetical protein
MIVPGSMLLVMPAQATTQEDPSLAVSTSLSGVKDLQLKAIQDSDGDIQTEDDFDLDLITLEQGKDFHVLPSQGSVQAVKVTDERGQTIDLEFSQADGRVTQDLASKAYLLDVIVLMENGDKHAYETILVVLATGQTLNQINTQNIIQNFVSTTSNSDTRIIFRDDNDDDEEEPSICYFKPNDSPECEPVDGECPEGFSMNEQGNCHPGGKCPDGFERVDDDESGTCYSKQNTFHCPISNAIVLDPDDCAIYEPDLTPQLEPEQLAGNNDTADASDIETEDIVQDKETEEALDSNCGGVPCTASEKEDSWLSERPETEPPTIDSEETESEEEN